MRQHQDRGPETRESTREAIRRDMIPVAHRLGVVIPPLILGRCRCGMLEIQEIPGIQETSWEEAYGRTSMKGIRTNIGAKISFLFFLPIFAHDGLHLLFCLVHMMYV